MKTKGNFKEYLKGKYLIENPWDIKYLDHFEKWVEKLNSWKLIEYADDYVEQL